MFYILVSYVVYDNFIIVYSDNFRAIGCGNNSRGNRCWKTKKIWIVSRNEQNKIQGMIITIFSVSVTIGQNNVNENIIVHRHLFKSHKIKCVFSLLGCLQIVSHKTLPILTWIALKFWKKNHYDKTYFFTLGFRHSAAMEKLWCSGVYRRWL